MHIVARKCNEASFVKCTLISNWWTSSSIPCASTQIQCASGSILCAFVPLRMQCFEFHFMRFESDSMRFRFNLVHFECTASSSIIYMRFDRQCSIPCASPTQCSSHFFFTRGAVGLSCKPRPHQCTLHVVTVCVYVVCMCAASQLKLNFISLSDLYYGRQKESSGG